MAPALGHGTTSQADSETRDAGFTSAVRITASRDLFAAGVRPSGRGLAGGAPWTRCVPRVAAAGPARRGPATGVGRGLPLSVDGDGSVLPGAPGRGHRG